jgi:predicted Rossmann-fold nucleotide-binding protein
VTRALICGGRNYADTAILTDTLDRLHAERGFSLVIAGGARGADTMGEEWARARGLPCDVYRVDWEGLGRKAGPIRNERMLTEGKPGLVVAFPGGRGTAHMTRIAREAGVEVIEIE